MNGYVYLSVNSQGQLTCRYTVANVIAGPNPLYGTLFPSTEYHALAGGLCPGKEFPFAVMRYTWGTKQDVEQDPFVSVIRTPITGPADLASEAIVVRLLANSDRNVIRSSNRVGDDMFGRHLRRLVVFGTAIVAKLAAFRQPRNGAVRRSSELFRTTIELQRP